MTTRLILFLLFSISVFRAFAQKADTVHLQEVKVNADRLKTERAADRRPAVPIEEVVAYAALPAEILCVVEVSTS